MLTRKRLGGGKRWKDLLIKNSPYRGLQQEIAFDANGDTPPVFFTGPVAAGFVKIPRRRRVADVHRSPSQQSFAALPG